MSTSRTIRATLICVVGFFGAASAAETDQVNWQECSLPSFKAYGATWLGVPVMPNPMVAVAVKNEKSCVYGVATSLTETKKWYQKNVPMSGWLLKSEDAAGDLVIFWILRGKERVRIVLSEGTLDSTSVLIDRSGRAAQSQKKPNQAMEPTQ